MTNILERQISDLKTKNNQYRVEIDSLSARISDMKFVVNDCSQTCSMISKHDEFCNNQKKINQDIHSELKRIVGLIDNLISEITGIKIENSVLERRIEVQDDNITSIYRNTRSHIEDIKRQEIPDRLRDLKNDQNNSKNQNDARFERIEKKFVIPFGEVLFSHKSLSEGFEKAIEDSQYSRELSDKARIEIKILNRKMNEILEKIKE